MEIALLIAGIAIGTIASYLILKFRSGTAEKVLEEKVLITEANLRGAKDELNSEREKVLAISSALSKSEAEFNNVKKKLEEQKTELEDLHSKFSTEFKNLANEILEDKSKKFTEQNKENMDSILKPLNEKIKDFQKKVEETYDRESKQRFSLEKEIKNLYDLNQLMTKEAVNLTNALKGQVKIQGNWGELILETILEKSGLQKDREYFVRSNLVSEDGKRLQPDIIIKLPGNKNIIVDAKVSLVAYELYCSADNDDVRGSSLKDHIQSVRNHIRGLSSKNYQDIYELNSLDFILMFLPVEPAFALAIHNDNRIYHEAIEKNILLVSPTNLLATLKTISYMWNQERQNMNAIEIARRSGALYDKFQSLMNDLINLGNRIKQAQNHYEDSMRKLYTGRGNLVSQVENIKKLGAKTTKSLPSKLLEKTEFTGNAEESETSESGEMKLL